MQNILISGFTSAPGTKHLGRAHARPAPCAEAQDVVSSRAAARASAPHLHAPNTQPLVTEASHG